LCGLSFQGSIQEGEKLAAEAKTYNTQMTLWETKQAKAKAGSPAGSLDGKGKDGKGKKGKDGKGKDGKGGKGGGEVTPGLPTSPTMAALTAPPEASCPEVMQTSYCRW
jgi:hypothetical protein